MSTVRPRTIQLLLRQRKLLIADVTRARSVSRVGSGDPVRVLRLFYNNYTGYCCIHLLCIATYNLSLPRLSANYYGLPTTVQLRAAHKNRCSWVGVSRSTALKYCTVPALNGIITRPFSPPFAGRSLGGI